MPAYTGYATLPDTCYKSGFSVTVSGVSNSESGSFVILGQNNNSTLKPLPAGNGTVSFSALDLANFNTTDDATLLVAASSISTVKIGNLHYQLANYSQFSKQVKVK